MFLATNKFNWTLLATDYDNYMIGYNCVNLDHQKSMHFAWLFGRSAKLNESVKSEVNALIEKYFVKEIFFGIYQNDDFCAPRVL